MPIRVGIKLRRMDEEEFKQCAYEVMSRVFEMQEELGRLFHESIYQRELAYRVADARREVPIEVRFEDFCKTFYLDLLVRGGAVFELKAVDSLTHRHRRQLLQYLFVTDVRHGKLVNLRPERVQHEFVNNTLTQADRCLFSISVTCEAGMMQESSVFERIRRLLNENNVTYDVLRHEPVYTSEEAAAIRETPLASGAKALICKGEGQVVMFVLPADRKLASREIRRARNWRKLRFLSQDEVLKLTGLQPGSIPPFGSLFDLPTLCDSRLGENDRINFNAGDHSISVSMSYGDYVRVETPEIGEFAAGNEG